MPAKNNLFVLFGILLVLAVSGCVGGGGGGTTATGGSVAITSFAADETSAEGNQKVTLTLDVKNQGDSKATSVQVQLLNLDLACDTGICPSTPTQWGLASGQKNDIIADLKVVAPGEEAVAKSKTWRVQAPQLPANMKQSYSATARVSYDYSTATSRQITLVTEDEYKRLKDAGQTLPIHTAVSSTGPVGIDVKVKEPVRIEEVSETFTLVISLSNLAGGTPFVGTNSNDATGWKNVGLKLTLPVGLRMAETGDCANLIAGTTAELVKGQTYTISCEVSADKPTVSVDKTVLVTATYGYFTDATATISVTGKAKY